jgi:hypothetical protein
LKNVVFGGNCVRLSIEVKRERGKRRDSRTLDSAVGKETKAKTEEEKGRRQKKFENQFRSELENK